MRVAALAATRATHDGHGVLLVREIFTGETASKATALHVAISRD
jgi:hypothetical protein